MDMKELFQLRENILSNLAKRINDQHFENEVERQKYHDACVDGVIEFYSKAMISILNNSEDKAA